MVPVIEASNLTAVATKLMMRFVLFGTRGGDTRAGDSSSGSDSDIDADELQALSTTWSAQEVSRLAARKASKAKSRSPPHANASYLSDASSEGVFVDASSTELPVHTRKKVRKVDREPRWDTHDAVPGVFQRYLKTLTFRSDRSMTGGATAGAGRGGGDFS